LIGVPPKGAFVVLGAPALRPPIIIVAPSDRPQSIKNVHHNSERCAITMTGHLLAIGLLGLLESPARRNIPHAIPMAATQSR